MKRLDRRIREGTVVQVNDKSKSFYRCIMIVDKVSESGVKCYMRIPYRGEDAMVFPFDSVVYIGEAAYVLPSQ